MPYELNGITPDMLAAILRKSKSNRNNDERPIAKAWWLWRRAVWKVEGDNEHNLKSLLRAVRILKDAIDNNPGETKKAKDFLRMLRVFLLNVWGIDISINTTNDIRKRTLCLDVLPNEWRDPLRREW